MDRVRSVRTALLVATLAAVGAGLGRARAEDAPPAAPARPKAGGTAEFLARVDRAIDLGVAWLKRNQALNGGWGTVAPERPYDPNFKGTLKDYPTGSASLGAYTLLKCGVPPDDAVVKRSLAFLKDVRLFPSSYELSMAILALTATADPAKKSADTAAAGEKVKLKGDVRRQVQDLVDKLLKRRAPSVWRYNWSDVMPSKGGEQDLSSTQLAALALLAAERAGISVESKVWNEIAAFAFAQQDPKGPAHKRALYPRVHAEAKPPAGPSPYAPPAGKPAEAQDHARGFAYILSEELDRDEGRPTGGMTACGIGIIAAARYVLETRGDHVWKRRDPFAVDGAIRDAAAWLDLRWSPFENPGKRDLNIYHVYYLYCVERAMDLVGASRIGSHDWFVEMGTKLLAAQQPDGSWDSRSTHKPYAFLDTCFALLFLHRATRGGIPLPAATADDPDGG